MSSQTERLLRSVKISSNGPGSILRDFATLLEFLGAKGVKVSGKSGLLPRSCLSELDVLLTQPVQPALDRLQQRSYPPIHGLYMLLRVTGLGVLRGRGAQCRLCVDQEMLSKWVQLDPAERYFNLLEAWLIYGSEEIWGDHGGGFGPLFLYDVCQFANSFLGHVARRSVADVFRHLGSSMQAHLALLEMFGLVMLQRQTPAKGENWHIDSAQLTDFGVGLFDLLDERVVATDFASRRYERDTTGFGVLQPCLGQFFPDWKNNLGLPEPEFHDGVYQFKVSLGDVWRRIGIPASCDLEQLASAILSAFGFDEDQLYCFRLRDRYGRTLSVAHPECDADVFADAVAVGAAPIREGETISFLYDFDDEWRFSVTLERVGRPDRQRKQPFLIESHGDSPPQYDWGDESEE